MGRLEQAPCLVGRDRELEALESLLATARDGSGALAVVAGPAGIGKTRLLEETRVRAGCQGMLALTGTGGDFERDVAFGVVRQLFERLLGGANAQLRAQALCGPARLAESLLARGVPAPVPGKDAPAAVRHGLYWLTANLADRAPVLIVVDDAHRIDAASAGWLAYMARRVAELRVVIALGVRTDEPEPDWQTALDASVSAHTIELPPLSQASSAAVVRGLLDHEATRELCLACHGATGGNPFLLSELVKTLVSERVPAGTPDLTQITQITPRRVARFVMSRLARLGPEAAAVAAAVAVLGERAQFRHVTALACLSADEVTRAADALMAAQILVPAPLGFVHPLVRCAVHNTLPPAGRARAHLRAARLLAAEQADSAAIAAHLLLAEPAADQQVVRWLRTAGKDAVAAGAPKMAAGYLARALDEPPVAAERAGVLHELGSAELLARQPTAIARLTQARDATRDAGQRAGICLELAQGHIRAGRLAEAGAVLDTAAGDLGTHPTGLLADLELYRCALGSWHPACAPALAGRMPGLRRLARITGHPGRCLALAIAHHDVLAGVRPSQALEQIERCLRRGWLIRPGMEDGLAASFAVRALTYLDELDRADDLAAEMAAHAARCGSVMTYAAACTWRAGVALARGSVKMAEGEACAALDLALEHDLCFLLPCAAAILGECLLEQDQIEAATRALNEIDPAAMGGTRPEARLLHVRARTALARGQAADAVADLRACQAIEDALGGGNPNVLSWRSTLALALAATAPREALGLAEAELKLARQVGQPRAIGVALRARALIAEPDPALLRQAADQLARSPARLEHARALADLGACLRRLNQRKDAREALESALELAHRCGAVALAERARRELLCCGARPRRPVRTGLDALTPCESRVAEMAAAGMNNREIAQTLFISTRTVATHLGHAYGKLGIASRAGLPAVLGMDGENHAAP